MALCYKHEQANWFECWCHMKMYGEKIYNTEQRRRARWNNTVDRWKYRLQDLWNNLGHMLFIGAILILMAYMVYNILTLTIV